MLITHWESAPQPLPYPHNTVHIWMATLETDETVQDALSALLSADELARANRYRFPHLRQRFIVGRGVLRVILGRYLSMPPHTLVFDTSPYGKPKLRLSSNVPALYFNVAHSHNLALYAICGDVDIGIDVEYLINDVNITQVAPYVLTAAEAQRIKTQPESKQRPHFFQYWTRKEAIIKAIGKGLSIPIQKLDVFEDILTLTEDNVTQDWHISTFAPVVDYVAALATPQKRFPLQCFQYEHDKLKTDN